jgi:hypothetical protein
MELDPVLEIDPESDLELELELGPDPELELDPDPDPEPELKLKLELELKLELKLEPDEPTPLKHSAPFGSRSSIPALKPTRDISCNSEDTPDEPNDDDPCFLDIECCSCSRRIAGHNQPFKANIWLASTPCASASSPNEMVRGILKSH